MCSVSLICPPGLGEPWPGLGHTWTPHPQTRPAVSEDGDGHRAGRLGGSALSCEGQGKRVSRTAATPAGGIPKALCGLGHHPPTRRTGEGSSPEASGAVLGVRTRPPPDPRYPHRPPRNNSGLLGGGSGGVSRPGGPEPGPGGRPPALLPRRPQPAPRALTW